MNQHKLNILLDRLGLAIAMLVDLILGFVFFIMIAVDPLTMSAFCGLAALAVLFKVRALFKGNILLWICFAGVTFFASWSLALAVTSYQTDHQPGTGAVKSVSDIELAFRQVRETEMYRRWQDLQEQYKTAVRRETMDQLDRQITEARQLYEKAGADRKSWQEKMETALSRPELKANDVFMAIPDAFRQGIWFRLVFFGFVFLTIELTIYSIVRKHLVPEMQTVTEVGAASQNLVPRADNIALPQPSCLITRRMYLMKSWPHNQQWVHYPGSVAKLTGWPLNLCEEIHDELYAGVNFSRAVDGLVPEIARLEFMLRRKNAVRA